MYLKAILSAVIVTSLLSSCGSLGLGDTSTLQLQRDAIFACVNAEGDDIFPIEIMTTLASGSSARAQIEPNERVSPALAAKINACAAARLASTQAAVETTTADPIVADGRSVRAAVPESSITAPAGCVPGSGALQGGARYCVGSIY